jgi:hypothetical protein
MEKSLLVDRSKVDVASPSGRRLEKSRLLPDVRQSMTLRGMPDAPIKNQARLAAGCGWK